MRTRARRRWFATVMVGALAAVVLFGRGTRPRDMPVPSAGLDAPPEVAAVLRRACYDCHSDETRWPWYAHVPPMSWLVAHDVSEGRRQVNFSLWNTYYPVTRRHKLQWMGRALRRDSMPPWIYCAIHPGARLTDSNRALLEQWITIELARQ